MANSKSYLSSRNLDQIKYGVSQTSVNCDCFCRATKALLPGRFNDDNLKNIWERLLRGPSRIIPKAAFIKLFAEREFTGSLKLTSALT